MNYKLYLTLLILPFVLSECNTINPKETIPTYIQIDSVQLLPTVVSKHGSVSHKITDVWVYYDRQIIGAFELPAKVPILATQTGQLQILAGIWENGLSGTRTKYPFYSVDTFTISPSAANTIKHIPTFTYRTSDSFPTTYFVEDFEQGMTFVKKDGDTGMIKTSDPTEVFEGNFSGKIALHDTVNYIQTITQQGFNIPPNRDCYMEFNFKSDVPFVLKTQALQLGNTFTSVVIGLNAKSEWTKVYINLAGFASTYQYANFKFMFEASLPSDKTKANVLIDNFKIIYFN